MSTSELSTVMMEARAAVEASHRLRDEMRMLRLQINQSLTSVRDSAATLALTVAAGMPLAGAVAPAAGAPVIFPLSNEPPQLSPEAYPPDGSAAAPRQLNPKDQMALDLLTPREIEVLRLIGEGQRTKEIAFTLGITFKTAVTHRSNIMEKLGIHEGPRLVRFAIRTGIATA
jgi:DNA-binding NarL/FixJ family response regulator